MEHVAGGFVNQNPYSPGTAKSRRRQRGQAHRPARAVGKGGVKVGWPKRSCSSVTFAASCDRFAPSCDRFAASCGTDWPLPAERIYHSVRNGFAPFCGTDPCRHSAGNFVTKGKGGNPGMPTGWGAGSARRKWTKTISWAKSDTHSKAAHRSASDPPINSCSPFERLTNLAPPNCLTSLVRWRNGIRFFSFIRLNCNGGGGTMAVHAGEFTSLIPAIAQPAAKSPIAVS